MFDPNSLQIIPGTSPNLRLKAKPIANPEDPAVSALIKQMTKTLRAHNGIGLAAPQVGQPIRLFIVEVDYDFYALINPEIKNSSSDKIEMEEGCLSFPGVFRPIKRSKKVTVSYLDQEGNKQRLKAKGMLARAIQHEFDHLEGILFIDR